jgi:hypothetical protein
MLHRSLGCHATPLVRAYAWSPAARRWLPTLHGGVSLSDLLGTMSLLDRGNTWSVQGVSRDHARKAWVIELHAGRHRYRYEVKSFKVLAFLLARSSKLMAHATPALNPRLALV